MKFKRQRWLQLALLSGVVGGLAYAFVPRPSPVDTAPVTRGPLAVTVHQDGRTRIKERYVVSTPLSGRLLRVTLHPGDPVEAGKTQLTALDPTDPELLDPRTQAQAEARVKAADMTRQQAVPLLEQARTTHTFARTELERARDLYRDRTVSHQELDNAEQKEFAAAAGLRAAQFAVQIADYELELARAALMRSNPREGPNGNSGHFPIVAPISGRVLRVFQESSAVVPAGARLLELGDPSDLEVEIDVLSADAVRIKPGAQVVFEHWGGDAPLHGRVRRIEPAGFLKISALGVEEQRVNVIVDFADPPEKRAALGDGYRVEARIVIWEAADVLKAPTGALFREGQDWAVFALVNGRARLQRLTLGHRNDLEAEVLRGLDENTRVIVHPSDQIQDGTRVRPR